MSEVNTQFTLLTAARLVDGNGGPVAEQAAVSAGRRHDQADRNERDGPSARRRVSSRDRLR